MPLGRSPVVLACLLAANVAAGADGVLPTRFVYERDPTAADCPDEATLRAEVARRVGRDPFADDAQRTIVCRVGRAARGLSARIEVGSGNGGTDFAREIVSRRSDCQNLAEAVAVALSIAVQPMVVAATPAAEVAAPLAPSPLALPAAVTPTPASPPAAPAPVEPVGPRRTDEPAGGLLDAGPAKTGDRPVRQHGIELQLGAGGGLAAGLSPGLTYAGDATVGLAGRGYSAELDLRLVGPSSRTVGRGSLTVWQWAVLVAPCAHRGHFAACLLGSAGMVYGSSEGLVITERSHSPQVAAGARAVAEYPLTRQRLRLRGNLDVTAALSRTHFNVSGEEAWSTPRAAIALGLGLVGLFF